MLEAVRLRSVVTVVSRLGEHRTDSRLLGWERIAIATTLTLRLRAVLRSQVHRRSLIVLNSGHAVLGHERTTNWRKLGALMGSSIDSLITLRISRNTTNLVTKLSVLQAQSVGLTTGSLSLIVHHRSSLALLADLTKKTLVLRYSY